MAKRFNAVAVPSGLPSQAPCTRPRPNAMLSCGCTLLRAQPTTLAARLHYCCLAAPPMEFRSPSTHEPQRVHFTPDCLPGYVPPSRFLTFSAAFSSLGPPAIFRLVASLGLRPSGDFPVRQVPRLAALELPSWRFSSCTIPRSAGTRRFCRVRGSHRNLLAAFRAFLRRRVRTV